MAHSQWTDSIGRACTRVKREYATALGRRLASSRNRLCGRRLHGLGGRRVATIAAINKVHMQSTRGRSDDASHERSL